MIIIRRKEIRLIKIAEKKDFLPENMSEKELNCFKKAFHPNGFVWCWGCQFAQGYHQVLAFVRSNPKYSKTSPKTFENLLTTFNFSVEDADRIYGLDRTFFPQLYYQGKFQLIFSKKGSEVMAFFKRAHEDTYCNVIAKSLKIKCYGAFIGTYSEDQNKLKKPLKFPLMSIPRGDYPGTKPDDFRGTINFFTKILKFKETPEDYGYGTYE